MLTHRERVRRAVHFQGPDRIPHSLPDGGENDITGLWIPRPPDIEEWHQLEDGRKRHVDCWGAVCETVSPGSFGEAVQYPIPDITRQSEFTFPDLNNPALFDEARKILTENCAVDDPLYCLATMPFSSLNAGVHHITGLENMFAAYYEHPDDLKALIGRMAEAQRQSIRMLADIGCDGVMGYDDWGLQDRLMVRLELIEEFFMPHYSLNWELAHDLGMDVWLHSCGYIIELLPRLADAGLNVIQQDQQENMGLENLDKAVGGKLAFWLPVDIQKTMVEGTEEDIREYVALMMRTVGNHRGGLISKAYPSPEACGHTPEKTAAMCRAFRELGVYAEEGKSAVDSR